jgi:hypothetical protein
VEPTLIAAQANVIATWLPDATWDEHRLRVARMLLLESMQNDDANAEVTKLYRHLRDFRPRTHLIATILAVAHVRQVVTQAAIILIDQRVRESNWG